MLAQHLKANDVRVTVALFTQDPNRPMQYPDGAASQYAQWVTGRRWAAGPPGAVLAACVG
jgi:hypothetical protein